MTDFQVQESDWTVPVAVEQLAEIKPDQTHPAMLANVHVDGLWLIGTPFAVLRPEDLRAWAAAFVKAADLMEKGEK